MVHEDTLSALLSEFAGTLLTDFPIQGILDRLVERIVDMLPVSLGGTLISPGVAPRYFAASALRKAASALGLIGSCSRRPR